MEESKPLQNDSRLDVLILELTFCALFKTLLGNLPGLVFLLIFANSWGWSILRPLFFREIFRQGSREDQVEFLLIFATLTNLPAYSMCAGKLFSLLTPEIRFFCLVSSTEIGLTGLTICQMLLLNFINFKSLSCKVEGISLAKYCKIVVLQKVTVFKIYCPLWARARAMRLFFVLYS